MSTRKDGLSIATVGRTVRRILDAHGVEVCGGNRRVLYLQRLDGAPDVGAALDGYGFTLTETLGVHGFTLRRRRGVTLVDLLQCDTGDRVVDLAEQVADRDDRDARAEWLEASDRGERPPGRSAEERGLDVGNETHRWALTQTAAYLQRWLSV